MTKSNLLIIGRFFVSIITDEFAIAKDYYNVVEYLESLKKNKKLETYHAL